MGGRRIRFLRCWMEHFLMMMRLKYIGGTAGSILLMLSLGLLASRRIMALISEQRRDQYEKSMNQGEKLLM